MIEAIQNFPTPTNVTGVRYWFGLINQEAYASFQAEVMVPFRELLKSKTFYWDSTLQDIFDKSKEDISQCIIKGVKHSNVESSISYTKNTVNETLAWVPIVDQIIGLPLIVVLRKIVNTSCMYP